MNTSPNTQTKLNNFGISPVAIVLFIVAITIISMVITGFYVTGLFHNDVAEQSVEFTQTNEGVQVTLVNNSSIEEVTVLVDNTTPVSGDNVLTNKGESITVQTNEYGSPPTNINNYGTVEAIVVYEEKPAFGVGKTFRVDFAPKLDTLPDSTLPRIVNSTQQ